VKFGKKRGEIFAWTKTLIFKFINFIGSLPLSKVILSENIFIVI